MDKSQFDRMFCCLFPENSTRKTACFFKDLGREMRVTNIWSTYVNVLGSRVSWPVFPNLIVTSSGFTPKSKTKHILYEENVLNPGYDAQLDDILEIDSNELQGWPISDCR